MPAFTRRTVLASLAALALTACHREGSGAPRCAFCGMRIAAGSHWVTGATSAQGAALAFDTPGCMFRYRSEHGVASTHDEWVTEYYGVAGAHTDARAVRYLVGSDVVGPMGPDLVPVSPARVETFRNDHHARSELAFDDVTRATLTAL